MDGSKSEILPPADSKNTLISAYKDFQATQTLAKNTARDSYIKRVLAYFRSKPRTQYQNIAEIHDRFADYEDLQYAYLKDPLVQLMKIHKQQYEAARNVIGATINLYADLNGVVEPLCVYWGGGGDRFAEALGRGWWRYIGWYDQQELSFAPKEWNVSGDNNTPKWIKGVPSLVSYDVRNSDLPSILPADSVDVSLYKTIGSVFVQTPDILNGFWNKIIRTTKKGGLIVSSDPLPDHIKNHFVPYEPMISTIGTSDIKLNAEPAYRELMNGYTSRTFSCFSLVDK